jgi:hypothetical protein
VKEYDLYVSQTDNDGTPAEDAIKAECQHRSIPSTEPA